MSLPMLNKYNLLLTETIEELKKNQEKLAGQIASSEEERSQTEARIAEVEARLEHLQSSIQHKTEVLQEYSNAIAQTENAYSKIIQSSQSLLGVLRRECTNLEKIDED